MKTNEGYMMTRAKSGDSFLSTKNSNVLTALASFYGKRIKTEKYVAVNVQGEYKAEAITKVTVL